MALMSNKTPQKQRKFLLPFKSSSSKEEAYGLLMLNATNYSDAVKIARCIAGPQAEKFLCYKDFDIDE